MKKPPFLSFYSLISGLLFSLAWPANGFPPLLFVAFVPLLLMEGYFLSNRSNNHSFGIFFRVWPAFIIWNGLTTWWIYNSTFFGVTMAVLINSVFMSLTFWLFHFMRRRLKNPSQGYLGLIFAWISFEFLHHHWDLNWPWLSLGNGFSAWPSWMQWYEFTGMFGGSLWVLVINILVYKVIQSWLDGTSLKIAFRKLWLPVAVMALPLAVSLLMYYTYREKTAPVDVVVVQPNIDPYEEQYELPADLVIEHATKLALTKADSLTDFVVFPESMV
ncbi:MAG TPA: hypothetical protein PK167_07045, partial [Prolixibacteraceae bacterium]|nr:hypothetical protein [Prolixibacteraceae bacterium]